jgi:hypothetical protein
MTRAPTLFCRGTCGSHGRFSVLLFNKIFEPRINTNNGDTNISGAINNINNTTDLKERRERKEKIKKRLFEFFAFFEVKTGSCLLVLIF